MTAISPAFTRSHCPRCEALTPCAACGSALHGARFVLLDNGGDEGENAVCPTCGADELGLPVCRHCGAYSPDSSSCADCQQDPWREAI
jgi:hypothetical protein